MGTMTGCHQAAQSLALHPRRPCTRLGDSDETGDPGALPFECWLAGQQAVESAVQTGDSGLEHRRTAADRGTGTCGAVLGSRVDRCRHNCAWRLGSGVERWVPPLGLAAGWDAQERPWR